MTYLAGALSLCAYDVENKFTSCANCNDNTSVKIYVYMDIFPFWGGETIRIHISIRVFLLFVTPIITHVNIN